MKSECFFTLAVLTAGLSMGRAQESRQPNLLLIVSDDALCGFQGCKDIATPKLPFLAGKDSTRPHATLFWRYNITATVRDGDWKLIRIQGAAPLLFNLAKDLSEKNNVAAEHPELVSKLLAKLADWEKPFPAPRWSEGESWEKIHFKDHTGPPKYQGNPSTAADVE